MLLEVMDGTAARVPGEVLVWIDPNWTEGLKREVLFKARGVSSVGRAAAF